jgi:exonuclease SbcC
MKIKSFSFKNICSYGNKLQTFTFSENPQLILIQGKNGSGKSSISDALTVSIYGRSAIRRTKEIPNRINKNAYTQVEFLTGSGDTVEIERGIEPNFSRLMINGSEHNLPDKRRVDDFIEEELTKIPFNVFSNTISLSVNDFKSFVKLSPYDKRQIIDKIFGLDIVNDMSKVVKDEIRDLKSSAQAIESSIQTNESILERSISQLENLKQDISSANDSRISEIKEEIESLEKTREQYKSDYSKLTVDVQENEKSLSTEKETRSSVIFNINEIQKKLSIYDKNRCPHCLSDLTDEAHIGIREKLELKKTDQETKLPQISDRINQLSNALLKQRQDQSDARDRFYQVDGIISPLRSELSTLSKESPSSQKGTEHLNTIIDNLKTDINTLSSDRDQLSDKIAISQEMDVILGDNGMKRLLMSQVIPMLNKKILKTSKLLEFKFSFEFDLDFNPIITHLGMQISPDSLSAGEQKKMNLIVLLCILELLKLKHHKVNLLFLDEVFSSLDVESIYRVVDLLKTFAKKYNMSVFVISHDPLPEEFFDMKLTIENVDHFSDITVS